MLLFLQDCRFNPARDAKYLLCGQRNNWMLSVYLLLRQTVHYHPNGLVRAEGDDAEPLRLAIRPVLEELHVLEVGDADVGHRVCNVLVRRPLEMLY